MYTVPVALDVGRLEGALVEAFDDRLIRSEEPWGRLRVRRLVLQFRFEVRLGVRDDEISLLFRATSPAVSRAADQARFEAALTAACAGVA